MQTIEITDVGPIKRLTIPYLEDGGLVVLTGANDAGKSESLKAIKRLVGGSDKITRRDGFAGRGSVEGLGVTLTLAASARQAGQCEVTSLEGKLDISDIVQPPIKAPQAADAHRIKAILQITGEKADIGLFGQLLSGGVDQLKAIVSADAVDATDIVEMARLVKRDLEQRARQAESQADQADGQVAGLVASCDGIDATAETDQAKLNTAMSAAIGELARLEERDQAAREASANVTSAKDRLAQLDASSSLHDLDAAEKVLADSTASESRAKAAITAAQDNLAAARKALDDANHAWTLARTNTQHAQESLDGCREFHAMRRTLLEAIESGAVAGPTADELAQAQQRVSDAQRAIEAGILARKALDARQQAVRIQAAAHEHLKQSATLRTAAQGTDAILSEAVKIDGIRVVDGRLITQKDGRDVAFADRSNGYRAKVAIDVALEQVRRLAPGRKACIVLDQQVFEGLDGKSRQAIKEHAELRKVCVYTAEATRDPSDSGEVRAEIFGE